MVDEVFVSPNHKANGFRCFNVLIGPVTEEDRALFFGPLTGDETFTSLNDVSWGPVLKMLGLFPSANQARNNGWGGDVPMGWSEAVFKKARTVVFVLRV